MGLFSFLRRKPARENADVSVHREAPAAAAVHHDEPRKPSAADRYFIGGAGVEAFYETMVRDLVKEHGKLEKVESLTHYPSFEFNLHYADGSIIRSGDRTGNYDIHFLTLGYTGEGPRYMKHFLRAAGFDVTSETINDIKPGQFILPKDPHTTRIALQGDTPISLRPSRDLSKEKLNLQFQFSIHKYSTHSIDPDERRIVYVSPSESIEKQLNCAELIQGDIQWSKPISCDRRVELNHMNGTRILLLYEPNSSSKEKDIETPVELRDVESGALLFSSVCPPLYYTSPDYWSTTLEELTSDGLGNAVHASRDRLLLLFKMDGDSVVFDAIKTGQHWNAPVFGEDGQLYFVEYGATIKVEVGRENLQISKNSTSNVCPLPDGRVVVGSGYSDRSAEAYIDVISPNGTDKKRMLFGDDPIMRIVNAGNGMVLVASRYSRSYADIIPYAHVSLVDLESGRLIWQLKIHELADYTCPLVMAVQEEGWFLLDAGRTLKRVAIDDGRELESIPKEHKERIMAKWSSSLRRLILGRYPEKGDVGSIEVYTMT